MHCVNTVTNASVERVVAIDGRGTNARMMWQANGVCNCCYQSVERQRMHNTTSHNLHGRGPVLFGHGPSHGRGPVLQRATVVDRLKTSAGDEVHWTTGAEPNTPGPKYIGPPVRNRTPPDKDIAPPAGRRGTTARNRTSPDNRPGFGTRRKTART